jgi:sugar phosphate isomerase/epimerase
MRIGLGSYSFRWAIGTDHFRPPNPLTPFDLVKEAAHLGSRVLQIADNRLLDSYTDEQLRDLRHTAEASSVSLEIGTSGATEARLLHYLDIAHALGTPLVRLVLDGPNVHPSFNEARDILRHIAPLYLGTGVSLAIENHFLLPSPELIKLVESVDSAAVGVCLDTANSLACQEWPLETVRQLAPYALNVHLKDYRIDPHPEGIGVVISGAPLGEGKQNIPAILEAISSTRKDINVILEQWLARQGDETATLHLEREWVERSLAAARQYLSNQAK